MQDSLILAVPAGRISESLGPLLSEVEIEPESDFDNHTSRKLYFSTRDPTLNMIRVRSFDVATFVAFGAAQIGIAGNDVIMEFNYNEIYVPLDLQMNRCRLSVAALVDTDDMRSLSHIRVATKYPHLTDDYFSARGIQAECIRLNGSIELAPKLGLCSQIVDLVQTGNTLRANGLIELETILHVTSRLIVNRTAFKTRPVEIRTWIDRFHSAIQSLPFQS